MHASPHTHRGRHHHHDRFGPFGPHGRWERGLFGGPPWGGRRARRGDVRTGLLALLADKPMHGYDLIRELEERSGGMWRPSPGSIYPTLQLLEDEELITGREQDGKRVYSITDAGRAELQQRRDRGEDTAPWEAGPVGEGFGELRDAAYQFGAAAMQVWRTGSETQRRKVAEILVEARKRIYAILAEG